MIHKANVLPRQRGIIAAPGSGRAIGTPMALFYHFDSQASSIANGPIS
jgi:ribosomal protein L27